MSDFDYEWSRYRITGTPEQRRIFDLYFDLVPATAFRRDAIVLDAGCGTGRWASQVADRGPRVVALDLGLSVELAQRNLAGHDVAFVQADLVDTPLAPASIDWVYSLGVLHHVNDPSGALSAITTTLKPNGALLLYLYYALDNRGKAFRSLFSLVNGVRRITSRLPRPAAHAFALIVAASIYLPLARLSLVLDQFGAHRAADALPLSMYRERSFRTMRNDSLDRFGTRLEKRFSRSEVIDLMNRAGLGDIRVSAAAPYWHAIGQRRVEQE